MPLSATEIKDVTRTPYRLLSPFTSFYLLLCSSTLVCRVSILLLLLTLHSSLFVLRAHAQSYEELVERGIKAAEVDSLSQAETYFKQALRLMPNDIRNALLYANLAKVQVAQGQPMKAIDTYGLALNIAPLNVPILKARGDLYFELGNYRLAAIDYGNILDVNANHLEALQGCAYIYQQRKDFPKAKEYYERLLHIAPDNYTARLGMAILLQEMGKPQEALTQLATLIDQNPAKAELYSVRAEIEHEGNLPELAIMDLDKAIALEPDNKNMVLTRAYIHKEMKNYRLARHDFERAIELGVPRSQLKQELKECK